MKTAVSYSQKGANFPRRVIETFRRISYADDDLYGSHFTNLPGPSFSPKECNLIPPTDGANILCDLLHKFQR